MAERQHIAQALSSLKPQHREVIALYVGENLCGEEIAKILGVEVKTVWTRLHRAREALNKALGGVIKLIA
ncbi:MAG: sigma-70 family RNA polymerase sigma factor [Deltaproteobacteria bacterium]|nr:sigma-70 family RNA polymerase sigma factor [Deltaproteobacteria bacterium]